MAETKRRSRGAGSYFKTSQGWVAQVRVVDPFTGKSRQIRRRAHSRDHARDVVLPALLSDPSNTTVTASGDTTVAAYLTHWAAGPLTRTTLAPSTKQMHADLLRWYAIPTVGSLRLSALDAVTCDEWLGRIAAHRKRDGEHTLSASTIRNTYNAVVKALDHAVKTEVLESNPMRLVERPKSPRPRVPVTKADDADRLLEAVRGRRIEHLVTFVMFTGCRVGEAYALRWDDVDLKAGTVTFHQGSHDRATTKSGRARTVPLLPEVVDALTEVRKRQRRERLAMGSGWQNDVGLVFTTGTGTPINPDNARRDLASCLKRAGVTTERPWHSLRHGLAHRLLQRGVPLQLVSAIIGHSSIQLTADLYGHVEAAAIPVDMLTEALGR